MINKRIFITGGTGFVGKSLLQHCHELKKNDLVILSLDSEKRIREYPALATNGRIHLLQGDVRDFEFPKGDFDYIFHGATTSCRIIPDTEMRSVVVEGTERILEFAGKNKNLKNFLYISSGAVYGKHHNLPMREDFPTNPENIYAESKLTAEKMCLESGLPCSIARCFAFVGEFLPLNAHFAIGNFINDCLQNKPIIIKGDGTPTRSYLYAGDLAHWLWTILIKGNQGDIYNVGSDQKISIADLAELVRKMAGTQKPINILTPTSGKPPQCYLPDIFHAKSTLGLDIEIPLSAAIKRTIRYHQRKALELWS